MRYKNLSLSILGIVIAVILSQIPAFHTFLRHLNGFGYLGAFAAGILFVSSFTVATGALVLFDLARVLPPLTIALLAGVGGVVGDLVIFRLVKNDLLNEIKYFYNHQLNGQYISRLLHTRYFNWMLPVIGAIIIASPLPDEIGVSLMGIAKMSSWQFIVLSFVLNSIGIFLTISTSLLF